MEHCPTHLALATYAFERQADPKIENHMVGCRICYMVWDMLSRITPVPSALCLLTAWATWEMYAGTSTAFPKEVVVHCEQCEVCLRAIDLVSKRIDRGNLSA